MTTDQLSSPAPPIEPVIAAAAGDGVVEGVAGAGEVRRAEVGEVLDSGLGRNAVGHNPRHRSISGGNLDRIVVPAPAASVTMSPATSTT